MANSGWSTPPTAFVEQIDQEMETKVRTIALAMLTEVIERSPVGNPDLWKANIDFRAKNVALADAYDANVDARNAENTGKKKFKKLTKAERAQNYFVNDLAAGKRYVGGRFRGSHIVSIGSEDFTVTTDIDRSGSITMSKGQAALEGIKPYTQVFIQTNLPYAERLENGHSTQAPDGVYELAFISVSEVFR